MKTIKALLVKGGKIERIDLNHGRDSGASHIHELVGGFFASCLNRPGTGRNRMVVGFSADDFSRDDIAWNVWLDTNLYHGGYAIKGSIVIVGHYGPESVDMNELEMASFRVATDRVWMGTTITGTLEKLPVLMFVPGYDVVR